MESKGKEMNGQRKGKCKGNKQQRKETYKDRNGNKVGKVERK